MTETVINGEQKPLLSRENGASSGSDSSTTVSEQNSCWCRCCRSCQRRGQKCFLVEPILILFALGIFPLSIVSQKYTIDWFTEHSVDAYARHNYSNQTSNSTVSACNANASQGDYDYQQYVQSEASQFSLYSSIVMGVPAVFVTIFLGAGSDHFGRRFAIIPPVFGVFASSFISSAIILTGSNVYWFFLSSFVSGCTGSFMSILMASFSYVADQTLPERRFFRILVVEMSLLISGMISPIANGTILQKFGYFYPLLFVVVTTAFNMIYVIALFPKNTRLRQDHLSIPGTSAHSEPTPSSFFVVMRNQTCSMFDLFFKRSSSPVDGYEKRRIRLNLLMLAFFITNLPTFDTSVSTLFEMNSPLCWNLDIIGLFSGLSSGVSGVGALVVTPLFKFCNTPDIVIAIIASLASLATSIFKVFVRNTLMMFLTLSIAMLRILFFPSLRTLLSREVSEEEQGSVFGAIACLEIICMTVGTVIFNSIYSATLFISTGFVFLVMGAFYLVGCILVCAYAVFVKLNQKNSSMTGLLEESIADVLNEETA